VQLLPRTYSESFSGLERVVLSRVVVVCKRKVSSPTQQASSTVRRERARVGVPFSSWFITSDFITISTCT
jgi:hypothetical protein